MEAHELPIGTEDAVMARVSPPPRAPGGHNAATLAFAAMPMAALIIGTDGDVIGANDAARRLLGAPPPQGDALAKAQRTFGRLARLLLDRRGSGPSPLAMKLHAGRRYVLRLVPLAENDASAAALLLVQELGTVPALADEDLIAAFGLTRAEAALALALGQGHRLNDLGQGSRSVSTLRVHLRHIFKKTGTSRQPDLVRLLMSLPPAPAEG